MKFIIQHETDLGNKIMQKCRLKKTLDNKVRNLDKSLICDTIIKGSFKNDAECQPFRLLLDGKAFIIF